jgi:hypothetical protein
MRLGIAPLAVGVSVSASRLMGSDLVADVLGYVYLIVITVMMHRAMTRTGAATAPARI